jgi:hypothetical protein
MIQGVEAGSSYLSQNDFRLHFGLANGEKIESVEIRWSDGSEEKVSGVTAGKITTIQKGSGVIHAEDFRTRQF